MINLLFFLMAFLQEEIPYKPKEEFEVKLNYEFKQRNEVATASTTTIDYREGQKEVTNSGGPLPYLTLNIKMIKPPNNEVRIKGENITAATILNKKVQEGEIIKMVLGFTDDLKDRVVSPEYNLYLVDGKKKITNRIHILVKEDGVFTVNGEKRGKF